MGFCVYRERERDILVFDNYSGIELVLNGVIIVDVFIIICVNYICIMIVSLVLEWFNILLYVIEICIFGIIWILYW